MANGGKINEKKLYIGFGIRKLSFSFRKSYFSGATDTDLWLNDWRAIWKWEKSQLEMSDKYIIKKFAQEKEAKHEAHMDLVSIPGNFIAWVSISS